MKVKLKSYKKILKWYEKNYPNLISDYVDKKGIHYSPSFYPSIYFNKIYQAKVSEVRNDCLLIKINDGNILVEKELFETVKEKHDRKFNNTLDNLLND